MSEKVVLSKEVGIGVVKSLIGAIPHAGTALNEAIFEVRARVKQQRLETFVQHLSERVSAFEEGVVLLETIKSDNFSDLLEEVVQKVFKNRSHTKLRVFTNIVCASMVEKDLNDIDLREAYTNIIATLDESEIEVLVHLERFAEGAEVHREKGQELEMDAIDYSASKICGVSVQSFRICFETLISKGLVFDDSFGRWSTPPRTFIKPTPLAIDLVRFVRSCACKAGDSI